MREGDLRLVHSGYPEARQEKLILEIRRRYRAERGENGDVLAALSSGEALLYPDMSEIASVRLSADEQELLRELDLRSSIVVPIHHRGRPLGILSFVSKSRSFEDADLELAQSFASDCARVLERAREQSEIARSLELLDRLYSQAPVGLAFLDLDLRFRRVNERLAEMNGVSVEAHIGRTLVEILGELGRRLAPLYERVIEAQREVSDEVQERRPPTPASRTIGTSHTFLSSSTVR